MKLNKPSMTDALDMDAEILGKAKFVKDNKKGYSKRKNLGSADNGYNVSMSKLPQTKFVI